MIFQSNLAGCIKSGDLTTFSALLAEVAPLDDQALLSLPDDENQVGSSSSLLYSKVMWSNSEL